MKKINFVVVLFLAFLAACANANESSISSNANASRVMNTAVAQNQTNANSAPAAEVSLNQAEQTLTASVVTERKIVRNADLELEAGAPEESQAKIVRIAEDKGGFVVESRQSSGGGEVKTTTRDTVTMTLRVPAAKFDETLGEIRQTASRVIVESIKGEDVTEEFIDIEARLKTQKALEAQFLEIMKRSNSVEDALNVQTEIARVRGEIEKIEGRKRFLESQASLSTIKIKLQTPAVFSRNSSGFFYQLREAFGDGFGAALGFVLFFVRALVALLPFFLLVVLPIYFVIRYFVRKNQKRKTAGEIAREEIITK